MNNFKKAIECLMGFIAALTIQNSISEICKIKSPSPVAIAEIYQIPGLTWLSFFTCITLSIRFFIGNFQYLNSDNDSNTIEITVDSATMLLQSAILAFASYFISQQGQFFIYISFLFIVELAWFFFTYIRANILKIVMPLSREMGLNQLTSFFTLGCLLLFALDVDKKQFSVSSPCVLCIIITVNLLLDTMINYKRYLGIKETVSPTEVTTS